MQIYVLQRAISYKIFMLVAFGFFALVMYQGHLKNELIYTILFIVFVALCSFEIVSIFYCLFVKRTLHFNINDKEVSWEFFDNKRLLKRVNIDKSSIKEVKSEVNYLTGNIYSRFTVTFILEDDSQIELTDGFLYSFGLKKAENISRYMLKNGLGNPQDIKFSKLIEELNIDIFQQQKFTKEEKDSYYMGVISKNKKEFLSLRLQIESLYKDYKIVEKNANNEYLVRNENKKESFIYLRSNAFGYFVEFYKVKRKEDLKMLKEMGRQKIGF
ncbi:hypothetical protein [Halarcobacter anaerophilus]|jgi:hypothetical protein|uniref:Uncharacterized protein n=1 Tax=Halarcobacter anaerophilus TaxID=877500 RepID=A0A4Q0XV45_9BACT|nr:hypothetical protein [Halarcobacter anaerophilus]QDF28034.1 putative membrane protein [Halarcobacter anaerophilus]RXJ61467.1 hypothetical protein CRV06_13670 [Halarcobacter anaerophilus]